jgi:hypothetical protein
MQDKFNKEDEHFTVIKLSGPEPQREHLTKRKVVQTAWRVADICRGFANLGAVLNRPH